MSQPSQTSDPRLMTRAQLDKLNKATLIDHLLSLNKDKDNSFLAIERKLDEKFDALHNELISLKDTLNEKNALIVSLQDRLDKQEKILSKQQRFLESVDREKREDKLVVTGISEDKDLSGASNDADKLTKIWEVMGTEVNPRAITRLGKKSDRPRPLLVKLDSKLDRDRVLEKKSALKGKGGDFLTIYVKKDSHPNVREEWKRLHDAERKEKERPENAGTDIKLNYKDRTLLRDGIVIDRWNPAPF